MRALFERAVAALLLDRFKIYSQIDGFYGIGVAAADVLFNSLIHQNHVVGVITVTTPTRTMEIDYLQVEPDFFPFAKDTRISSHVPVVVMYSPPPVHYGKITSLVQSFGQGASQPLHPSERVFGTYPTGLRSPGLTTAFVRSNKTGEEPLLLGSHHVLGSQGRRVVRGHGGLIGHVVDSNEQLDASVVELNTPWEIDHRLPALSIAAGPPIMVTSGMNVQFVDQKGQVQIGAIVQSNFFVPGQASIGLTPNFTTTLNASQGDSGAPILSGHFLMSALEHYAGQTDPSVLELYRGAMLGHILGGAAGGPAAVISQTIGIPITEVLAGLNLEPLYR